MVELVLLAVEVPVAEVDVVVAVFVVTVCDRVVDDVLEEEVELVTVTDVCVLVVVVCVVASQTTTALPSQIFLSKGPQRSYCSQGMQPGS